MEGEDFGAKKNLRPSKLYQSVIFFFSFWLFGLLAFLGLHLRHVEVPRLGVELEL